MASGDNHLVNTEMIIQVKPNSNGITIGRFVCLTGTEIGSTHADDYAATTVIGVALGTETDTDTYVAVAPIGVFTMTSTTGATVGTAQISESNTSLTDGSNAGQVLAKALQTVAAAGTGKFLINI